MVFVTSIFLALSLNTDGQPSSCQNPISYIAQFRENIGEQAKRLLTELVDSVSKKEAGYKVRSSFKEDRVTDAMEWTISKPNSANKIVIRVPLPEHLDLFDKRPFVDGERVFYKTYVSTLSPANDTSRSVSDLTYRPDSGILIYSVHSPAFGTYPLWRVALQLKKTAGNKYPMFKKIEDFRSLKIESLIEYVAVSVPGSHTSARTEIYAYWVGE